MTIATEVLAYVTNNPEVGSLDGTTNENLLSSCVEHYKARQALGTFGLPFDAILTYTWATRPNYSTTPAGTVINLSDVGGPGGSFWKATTAGWVPLNGRVILAKNWGSVAVPVAPVLNTTGALFVPTGGAGSLVIPATMLISARSTLIIQSLIHRDGVTATGTARIYMGTAGTASDSSLYGLSLGGTEDLQARPFVEAGPVSATSVTSTNYLSPGNGGTANVVTSVTTNINTAAAMTISFGMSTTNASDTFSLIGYTVELASI